MEDLLLIAALIVCAILAISRLWELIGPNRDSYVIHNQVLRRASDGLLYRVHGAHDDSRQAAEVMAKLSRFNVEFLRHIRHRYIQTQPEMYPGSKVAIPPPNAAERARMKNLLDRYNPDVLNESSPFNPRGDTSFTVSKGRKLALCLRNKKNGALHKDIHTLEFVTLHELAHMAENDWGHKRPFWVSFKWVLHEGALSGLHQPADYAAAPKMYCGLNVAYQPYHDTTLDNIWLVNS